MIERKSVRCADEREANEDEIADHAHLTGRPRDGACAGHPAAVLVGTGSSKWRTGEQADEVARILGFRRYKGR